jgi:hypothetical protein
MFLVRGIQSPRSFRPVQIPSPGLDFLEDVTVVAEGSFSLEVQPLLGARV